jgi:uncharacterized protein
VKKLLIIFVKNIILGNVKTRLAKTVGDEMAILVYRQLLTITEEATSAIDFDKVVYFSDNVSEEAWINFTKEVQFGKDLGERMSNAFTIGFMQDYESIVLIGSDLPEISEEIILKGFKELETADAVFGPASDGGYYLIGMNSLHPFAFENKPWSKSNLLEITLKEFTLNGITFSLIDVLNDIDTIDDLLASSLKIEK